MEQLLNFDGPFDVKLLDQVVEMLYTGNPQQVSVQFASLLVVQPTELTPLNNVASSRATWPKKFLPNSKNILKLGPVWTRFWSILKARIPSSLHFLF